MFRAPESSCEPHSQHLLCGAPHQEELCCGRQHNCLPSGFPSQPEKQKAHTASSPRLVNILLVWLSTYFETQVRYGDIEKQAGRDLQGTPADPNWKGCFLETVLNTIQCRRAPKWYINSKCLFKKIFIMIIISLLCCAELCSTLCNPMDCSPPGSSIHGILQARIRVSCHFLLRESSQSRDRTRVSWVSCGAGGFFITKPHEKPLCIINSSF